MSERGDLAAGPGPAAAEAASARADPDPSPGPAAIPDGLDKSLDPASVTVARIGNSIATAVLGLVALVALVVLLLASSLMPAAKLTIAGGLLAVLAGLAAWGLYWPGVRYRYASYRLGERGIQIRRGVLWRSVTTVPKSRVQHTDVTQGPIDRGFGLATLVIHTAGTQEAVVTLGGLSHPVALAIRDYLIGGGEDDAV